MNWVLTSEVSGASIFFISLKINVPYGRWWFWLNIMDEKDSVSSEAVLYEFNINWLFSIGSKSK